MAFLTRTTARDASPAASLSLSESELRKSASTPRSTHFDIFLSHSYDDAVLIAGVKRLLEARGQSVYVDWDVDPLLNRQAVTPATAEVLRLRMRNSKALIYASSTTSSGSKWMPWELGYFDGFRPGHVAVMPIVMNPSDPFDGQEYLGLYPLVHLNYIGGFEVRRTATSVPLRDFAS